MASNAYAVSTLEATLDPARKSWVESANFAEADFSIQNLPFGVFSDFSSNNARVGVAIGDFVLDLSVLEEAGLLSVPQVSDGGEGKTASVFRRGRLNDFVALGKSVWSDVRCQLSTLLSRETSVLRDDVQLCKRVFIHQADATMHLPFEIPGYTDFYSSREHATNVGSMFRDPRNALMPNWLEIPIGYNGRASSVVVSGTPVRRPNGQRKAPDDARPTFGPCRKLDVELETGFFIGVGSKLGSITQSLGFGRFGV